MPRNERVSFEKRSIAFSGVDVLNDTAGRAQLFKLGVRTVPVLARGEQFIFCQNLEDVAEFVASGVSPVPCTPVYRYKVTNPQNC